MLAFVEQVIKNYHHTGAILPSSPRLAIALSRPLSRHEGRKRVLEVGPGTGPVTRVILKHLRQGDELDIVEINPAFCRLVETRLLEPFSRRGIGATVRMHCSPIETAPLEGPYDYVVCSLPFNNFKPALVRAIFRRMLDLLKPGGELTYFEYAGVRVMKGAVVGDEGRQKLRKIGQVGKVLHRRYAGRRKLVMGNMPPAIACSLTR